MKKMFLLFTLIFFFLNTVGLNCGGDDSTAAATDKVELGDSAALSAVTDAIKFQSNHQQSVEKQKPVADYSLDQAIETKQNEMESACKSSTARETYSKSLPKEITYEDINKQRIRNSFRRLFNVKEKYTIKFKNSQSGYISKSTVVFDKTNDGAVTPKIKILTYQKTFALFSKGRLLHSAEAMPTQQSIQNGQQNSFKYTPISETSYNHGHLESITHYQGDKIRTIKYNQMGRISEDKTYAKIQDSENKNYYLTRHLTHEYERDDQRAILSTKIHNPENSSKEGELTITPTYEPGIISDNVRIGHAIKTIIEDETITNYHKLNGKIHKTEIIKDNKSAIFDNKKRITEYTDNSTKNLKTKFKYGFFTGKLKSVETSSIKEPSIELKKFKVELSKTNSGDKIYHIIDPKSGRIIKSISKDGQTTLTHEYDNKGKHTSSSSSLLNVKIEKKWYRTTKADVKATVKTYLSTLTSS